MRAREGEHYACIPQCRAPTTSFNLALAAASGLNAGQPRYLRRTVSKIAKGCLQYTQVLSYTGAGDLCCDAKALGVQLINFRVKLLFCKILKLARNWAIRLRL